ncbi:GNAT family N-acetyltransferase [Marinobacterium litorale]|uniref:GNAT family N-acetyltransferase n=1 Tax=Marinobacterium litorale TaxID=404770 RepID=UPI000416472D|nr:GNAT family N-acetyltransferase [Marinobacterium litorale]
MNIRPSTSNDIEAIIELFHDSVHQIAVRSYSPEQLSVWAPEQPDIEVWRSLLHGLETLVAEVDGVMAGFISFSAGGHIDLLYTSPRFSRRGVASALYEAAVRRLLSIGVQELSTEASLEARPFFQAKGFGIVEEQLVERQGVRLKRFAMRRVL